MSHSATASKTEMLDVECPERFTYDVDGNMTSDGRFAYTWDDENRMASASNAEVVVTYAYDHKGRMIRKTVSRHDSEPQSMEYVWDGWNIVRETHVSGLVSNVTYNLWGLDLDGTPQGAGGVGGLLAVVREDGAYIPTYDANGNISEYIDSSDGTVAAHYDYSPFGEPLVASGPLATSFTHRFSTKPWCGETKLLEYQRRQYQPILGRFLSRDNLESEYALPDYRFAENSPLSIIDVLGNFGCVPTPEHSVKRKACCGNREYDPDKECCVEDEDDGRDEPAPPLESAFVLGDSNTSLQEVPLQSKKIYRIFDKRDLVQTDVVIWKWRGRKNAIHEWITWPGGSADAKGLAIMNPDIGDFIVRIPAIGAKGPLEDGVTYSRHSLSPCTHDANKFSSCVARKAFGMSGKKYGLCYKFVEDVIHSCEEEVKRR